MRLLVLLALALLPACRTVQTVALTPSLEEAVAAANGRIAAVTFADGKRVRPASLALRDSVLVYTTAGSETRYERPARTVARIVLDVSHPAVDVLGYGLSAVGMLSGTLLGMPYGLFDDRQATYGFAGLGAGLALNAVVNPHRKRVIYRAVHRPTPLP